MPVLQRKILHPWKHLPGFRISISLSKIAFKELSLFTPVPDFHFSRFIVFIPRNNTQQKSRRQTIAVRKESRLFFSLFMVISSLIQPFYIFHDPVSIPASGFFSSFFIFCTHRAVSFRSSFDAAWGLNAAFSPITLVFGNTSWHLPNKAQGDNKEPRISGHGANRLSGHLHFQTVFSVFCLRGCGAHRP